MVIIITVFPSFVNDVFIKMVYSNPAIIYYGTNVIFQIIFYSVQWLL